MRALILFLLLSLPTTTHAGLFGSKEFKHDNFNLFPKWTGVMARYKTDTACTSPNGNQCIKWREFLDSIRGESVMDKVKEVNYYMNNYRYIVDPVNWNMPDYWATPKQFFSKNGDCEDYAIAKFESLRYLGVSNENMRIVILQDLNLNVAHAVLAVYINGTPYILDNQAEQVIRADKIRHYMPIYSINETGWWQHG